MSWQSPELLWLLLLCPAFGALIFYGWRLRLRALARFGTPRAMAALVTGDATLWRTIRATLYTSALALVIAALAGPQFGSHTETLRKRGLDLVLAVDFSKSMLAEDVRPSRIARVKAEIVESLEELRGDRIGLVAFAGDTMEFPLTYDQSAVALFLGDLDPADMPVGGTAIGRALVASGRLLARSRKNQGAAEAPDAVVVLLTDGEDHEGEPIEAAKELAKQKVTVFTIGVGTRTGEPIPTFAPDGTQTGYMRDDDGKVVTTSLSKSAERQLKRISTVTGGTYLRAKAGGVGLRAVRRELQSLKMKERDSRNVRVLENRFALPLFFALVLLLLDWVLPHIRRKGAHSAEELAEEHA